MFRLRTALAGAAVAAAAVLTVAAPASAHDSLVASSPADGEQVATSPEQIVLTFSNTLIAVEDEDDGTAVVVEDAAGRDWAGEPVIEGDTVTVPLEEDLPPGDYRVTWQVVSSDGHPTSGEYGFTVLGATASADPAPTPTEPSATPDDSDALASSEEEPAPWPLLIGLGVVLLVAIATAIALTSRKRH